MRAVVYTRYSTEQQEDSSIAAQFRATDEYVQRQGWTLSTHFKDEGLSGGDADRPGYNALKTAAEAGEFDIVVVDEVSRLWRNESEQFACVELFKYCGVHVVGISDGTDTRREGFELLLSVRGGMNAEFIRFISKKTHKGLKERAMAGLNAGGRSYGYKLLYETIADERGKPIVKPAGREIDPEQAEWVRKIFTWYADGYSPRWIAAELNRLGVPSPSAGWKRKQRRADGKWVASAIYGDMKRGSGILNNELYIGRYVWNRSKYVKIPPSVRLKRNLKGKAERRDRPKSEWVISDVPQLRIVDQDVWDRVKARQQETRHKSANLRAALSRTGAGPKFLFSGLLKCSRCGSSYVVVDRYQYGCASYTNGGEHACGNKLRVARKLVERRLLEGIKKDLFTPEAIDFFKKETTRLLAERRKRQGSGREQKRRRLDEVSAEIENIMAAIKAGIVTNTTKAELEKAEAERDRLQTELTAEVPAINKIVDVLPRAVDRYRKLVENLENIPQREVARARTQIKHLVGGAIKLIPSDDSEYLEAELNGHYEGLVRMAAGGSQISVVGRAGIEPATT